MNLKDKMTFKNMLEKKAIEVIERILGRTKYGQDILLKDEIVISLIKEIYLEAFVDGMTEAQKIYQA